MRNAHSTRSAHSAHLFLDMTKSPPEYLYGLPPERVLILVGTFSKIDAPSKWRYRAELVTPMELLLETTDLGTAVFVIKSSTRAAYEPDELIGLANARFHEVHGRLASLSLAMLKTFAGLT